MSEEKLYIGSKIILGSPMDEYTFLRDFKKEVITKQETRAGYKVTYPDGYVSWSPKEVFENAHREVTFAERDLILVCQAEEVPDIPDIPDKTQREMYGLKLGNQVTKQEKDNDK